MTLTENLMLIMPDLETRSYFCCITVLDYGKSVKLL